MPGFFANLENWPGPLLAVHIGKMSADLVLKHADSAGRKAEVHFQLGILALGRDLQAARQHFQQVVEFDLPFLIEHAAARHELMRWRL